jgi:hypothetical protein
MRHNPSIEQTVSSRRCRLEAVGKQMLSEDEKWASAAFTARSTELTPEQMTEILELAPTRVGKAPFASLYSIIELISPSFRS